jgi:hypothetical protein
MRQIVAFILAAVLGCANLATARADRHQQAVGAQEVIFPADGGPAAAGFAIFQTSSEVTTRDKRLRKLPVDPGQLKAA